MEFLSSVEELSAIQKKITVTVPEQFVSAKYEESIKKIIAGSELKGFRKGKAPRHLVEPLYQEKAVAEAIDDLINNSYFEALSKHEIVSVGYPEIAIKKAKKGDEIQYEATVPVKPEPEIKKYDMVSVEVESRSVTDDVLKESLQYLLKKRAKISPLNEDRVIKEDDIISGILISDAGGEESSSEPVNFCVGEGTLPKEIEAAVIGAAVGDNVEADVVFPSDHSNAKFKGKTVKFSLKVESISVRELPVLDDEFVKSLNGKSQTVDELRIEIKNHHEKQFLAEKDDATITAIEDAILAENEFEVPQQMIDDQIKEILIRFGYVDPNKTDLRSMRVERFRETMGVFAKRSAMLTIVYEQLIKKINPVITEQQIEEYVNDVLSKDSSVKRKNINLQLVRDVLAKIEVQKVLKEKAKVKYIEKRTKDNE